jgi:hypothetical protein
MVPTPGPPPKPPHVPKPPRVGEPRPPWPRPKRPSFVTKSLSVARLARVLQRGCKRVDDHGRQRVRLVDHDDVQQQGGERRIHAAQSVNGNVGLRSGRKKVTWRP